jgi:hypothetical protein
VRLSSDAWFFSMCVRPPVILRRRLHALSLFHSYFVRALGNPVVCGGYVSRYDAAAAVFLFSLSRRQLVRLVYSPWAQRRMHAWIDRQVKRNTDVREDLLRYVAEYTVAPKWAKTGSGGVMGAPPEHHYALALTRDWGMTYDAAWDTPFGVAACCYATSAERESGPGCIVPPWQIEIEKMIKDGAELSKNGKTEDAKRLFDQAQSIARAHMEATK